MTTKPGGAELNFQLLGSGGGSGLSSLRTIPAGVSVPAGEVLFAVGTDGTRHLLVPADPGEESLPDRQSAGVHLVEQVLIDDTDMEIRFLDAVCRLPRLERLFSALVDEIIESLRSTEGSVWSTCRAVLERWRELLGAEPSYLLSRQQVVGLLAELLVMERIALISPGRALEAWRGWDKDKVDFQRGETALEVKASIAREGRMVTIHGLQQLEIPAHGTLHLLYSRLEAAGEDGESLPGVLTRLVSQGVSASELHRRLGIVGYDPADSQAYALLRFRPSEHALIRVDGSFPRIVGSSFPGGSAPDRVSEVNYRVDLAGYSEAPPGEVDGVVGSLAGS